MSVSKKIDLMIQELEKLAQKPEYIIMGKNFCMDWLREIARSGVDLQFRKSKKWNFKHRSIPVIVCESDILEVVPNSRFLLSE